MATDKDFIDYVCNQLREAGNIQSKKMFGEYMVYCHAKPILLVCNNIVFAKMLPEVAEVLAKHEHMLETDYPYNGAKEHYIVDIDDKQLALT
jgi:TfoX/Sxy family transcriptional regulator of competence genes